MNEENKPVTPESGTGNQPVKPESGTDEVAKLRAQLAEEQAKSAKLAKTNEIYKNGLLTAKKFAVKPKATAETVSSPEKLNEFLDQREEHQKFEQVLPAAVEPQEPPKPQVDEVAALRKQIEERDEELRAFRQKGGSPSAPASGAVAHDAVSAPIGYWSDDQRKELADIYRQRGHSEESVQVMVAAAERTAKEGSAGIDKTNYLAKKRSF